MPHRVVRAEHLVRNSLAIIIVGLGLVLAAALAVAWLVIRSNQADSLVERSLEIRTTAETLSADIQGAETGQRGFLLTGDDAYLPPYDHAQTSVPELLDLLHELTEGDPEQRTTTMALEPLISAKLSELHETVELAQQGERNQAIAIVNTDRGRGIMEAIRTELGRLFDTNSNRLLMQREDAAALRQWVAVVIFVALALAVLLIGILAVATRHAVEGLIERTHELQEESRLRIEAEETLRQAQKMEAVGQLTGGIAHDFNNLLTIIMGNLDTVKRRVTSAAEGSRDNSLADRLQKPIDAALYGARSAAQLTDRLLAFSRRQTLEPVRVDVNRLVGSMLDMLQRSLGEKISVETVLAAGLWPSFADPHQLENVVVNLALNARDAMPEGGCLTIETANTYLDDAYARRFGDVEPGQYVMLCVTDTGTGIPESLIDHVFEPFFTTKPAGEGSGLGLSMVHGFVKQSGGQVRIYSEEDEGTTVKVYLPRMTSAEERIATPAAKEEAGPVPRAKPNETILLVEDNAEVRDYAKGVLIYLGYSVMEAADAEEALRLIADDAPIDLLFTDVVLPDSNGRALAEHVKEKHPSLPVLYTTGYTRNAIVHQGRLDADVHLLNKPYTEQELAHKVRALLDSN